MNLSATRRCIMQSDGTHVQTFLLQSQTNEVKVKQASSDQLSEEENAVGGESSKT